MTAEFVAGDTGAKLRVQCLDLDTAEPISLAGASVSVRWRIANRPAVTKSMTVVDAALGQAEYQFADGELASGPLRADVVITRAGATLTSADALQATVRDRT